MKNYFYQLKLTFVLLLFSMSIHTVKGQGASAGTADQKADFAFENMYDLSGKKIESSEKLDVVGTAMLNENWAKGIVKLKSGRQFRDVDLQFNVSKNELQFMKKGVAYTFVEPVVEFSFSYLENEQSHLVFFRSGYPDFRKQNANSLYEVITIGKNVHLLKYLSKNIKQTYEYSGPTKKEYALSEDWYVLDVKNNKLSLIKKDIVSLSKALPDYAASIHQLVKEKKYKLKEDEGITSLINDLNR